MEGLYGIIHESYKRAPDRVFIRRLDRSWTYREVYNMVQRVSGYLLERGVQKGDPVILFCDNSIEYIAAFFAILKLNAVAVPVNPAKMTESLLYIIEKCRPGLILACDSTIGKLEKTGDELGAEVVNIDCNGFLDRYGQEDEPACVSAAAGRGVPGDRPGFLAGVREIPALVPEFPVDEDDPAVILFTSGTTALPKGVTLTHGNLLANTRAILEYLQLTGEDSILMTLPFTYSYGNSVLLTHAAAGASIVIENSTIYPYKILEGIRDYKVSGFSTVGSYINLMLKCIKNSASDESFFKNLRYITFAGESTNNEDIRYINQYFPDVKVFVMYGQTEASARLSYLSPERLHDKLGSIGRGLCNVELKVVDGSGYSIRPGEIGEIIARGPSIMKGYWKDSLATGEVLREGWLYTGDTATVDEDGYIYIKGRKTDMIKHMGHRISPAEIEEVINSCGFVKESAVIESTLEAIPVIKAFVVLERECPPEEIRRVVHSKLPNYMRPQVFEVIEQLPRTDSGKIKRSALRRNK